MLKFFFVVVVVVLSAVVALPSNCEMDSTIPGLPRREQCGGRGGRIDDRRQHVKLRFQHPTRGEAPADRRKGLEVRAPAGAMSGQSSSPLPLVLVYATRYCRIYSGVHRRRFFGVARNVF